MGRFTLTVKLSPSALFGVPQEGSTVLPATRSTEFFLPSFNGLFGTITGHGTLSKYRSDEESVQDKFKAGLIELDFDDNFLSLSLESDDYEAARGTLIAFLDHFLIQLSVRLKQPFDYEILGLADDKDQKYPVPKVISLAQVSTYNLDQIREVTKAAILVSGAVDDQLDRASQYFEHATFLFNQRQLLRPGSRHYTALMSSIFLNIAKSVTVIVGDPSNEHDHQRRYRKFGLDKHFYENKIKRIFELRNNYDVAHHDLGGVNVATLEKEYGEALDTASIILSSYSNFLASAGS